MSALDFDQFYGRGDLFTAEVTTDATVTSSDVTNPSTIISLGPQTYSAVPTWFEFSCPAWSATASGSGSCSLIGLLNDGTTELSRIFDFRVQAAGAHLWGTGGILARVLLIPSAGDHTYLVAGARGGNFGNATFSAGTGTAGSAAYSPIYLRAYLA